MIRPLVLALAIASAAVVPGAPPRAQEQVLNLQDADIRAFIQDVARATGRTFVIDPRVQGRVTIASQEPLSRNELFEVMLSTLRANGLVAVPTGAGVYRIAPEEGAAQQPSTLGSSAGFGFATQVFRLKTLDAAAAAETLKPLIGRQGVLLPSRQGNLLVAADYADNLQRIRNILAQIDQDGSITETVALRSASAREIATVVQDLLRAPGEPANTRSGLVSVTPVESSNVLILRGAPERVRPLLPVIADLDRRAEASGDVRVVRLQHASAEDLLPVLQQIVGQQATLPATTTTTPSSERLGDGARNPPPGAGAAVTAPVQGAPALGVAAARSNIARFPGTNAIVIAADPDTQRRLVEVIRQLDVRREQVLVEAIVVEVSDNAAKNLGVQFALSGTGSSAVPFSAANYSNSAPSLLALAGAAAAETNLPEGSDALETLRQTAVQSLLGVNGFIGGGAGRIGDDALFGFIINAVKSDTASNLLSTPSVLTLDNQQATILVGQEVPITTGEVLGSANVNPFRTIQRQNVGVQLEVKPQINAGGAITLFLRQEVSSVAGPVSATFNELILNKREIETTINVDNGEIVVLGGLLDQNDRLSVDRTPGLGEVPVLGALFRSKARERNKTNLMIFIRPTILRNAADARAATAPRYDYIRDQQIQRSPDRTSELERVVREYLKAQPPTAPEPKP